jgi:hypothetical protein
MTAWLDGTSLRRVSWNGSEVIQGIVVAVRDEAWNTIPADIAEVEIDGSEAGFDVSFRAGHVAEGIALHWTATIRGLATGTIEYAFDGVFDGPSVFNRIGFNVLLGSMEYAGQPYRARASDGSTIAARFPVDVQPQAIVDDHLAGFAPPFVGIAATTIDGVTATIELGGDEYEVEDQRNWTDASYKLYTPPLTPSTRRVAEPGDHVRQRVVVALSGTPTRRRPTRRSRTVELDESGDAGRPPDIGIAMGPRPVSAAVAGRFAELAPAHLRVDVRPDPSGSFDLEAAAALARPSGSNLEVALHLPAATPDVIEAAASVLRPHLAAGDVILAFAPGRPGFDVATSAEDAVRIREALQARLGPVRIGSGTDSFFSALNRSDMTAAAYHTVAWSMSPTVHASDTDSIVENLAGVAAAVLKVRGRVGDLPIRIGPVTLQTRNGPYPAGPASIGRPDPRLTTSFAAAWAIAVAAELAKAGIEALTFFATTGLQGILDEAASPRPTYHAIAALQSDREASLVPITSAEDVAAIAFRAPSGTRLVLASMRDDERSISVGGLSGRRATVRSIEGSALERSIEQGVLSLDIGPFGALVIEIP